MHLFVVTICTVTPRPPSSLQRLVGVVDVPSAYETVGLSTAVTESPGDGMLRGRITETASAMMTMNALAAAVPLVNRPLNMVMMIPGPHGPGSSTIRRPRRAAVQTSLCGLRDIPIRVMRESFQDACRR